MAAMLESQNDLETKCMTSGLRITNNPVGFKAGELVACARCHKPNGPDRSACLYCGETLQATTRNVAESNLPPRKLEAWEPGFNLIMLSKNAVADSSISAASKLLGVNKSVVVSILDSALPLPLARIESKELADELVKRLSDFGFAPAVIADADLTIERPPIRLRNLSTDESQLVLTDFNSGKTIRIDRRDVALIVTGRIVETRRDEITKRKKGKTKVVDEIETGSDLRLIDLYAAADVIGYRIQTNGFDFSLLGKDKSMLANENIEKLADVLEHLCPNAMVTGEYDSVRRSLDAVWEPEARKDVHGLQLRSYGRREFSATYTSSNLTQFTNYSRMRRLLI